MAELLDVPHGSRALRRTDSVTACTDANGDPRVVETPNSGLVRMQNYRMFCEKSQLPKRGEPRSPHES